MDACNANCILFNCCSVQELLTNSACNTSLAAPEDTAVPLPPSLRPPSLTRSSFCTSSICNWSLIWYMHSRIFVTGSVLSSCSSLYAVWTQSQISSGTWISGLLLMHTCKRARPKIWHSFAPLVNCHVILGTTCMQRHWWVIISPSPIFKAYFTSPPQQRAAQTFASLYAFLTPI